MSEADEKVEACVERLCDLGCRQVTGFIEALKAGQEFPEVADLGMADRRRVLEELVSIMDVYEGRCGS